MTGVALLLAALPARGQTVLRMHDAAGLIQGATGEQAGELAAAQRPGQPGSGTAISSGATTGTTSPPDGTSANRQWAAAIATYRAGAAITAHAAEAVA